MDTCATCNLPTRYADDSLEPDGECLECRLED